MTPELTDALERARHWWDMATPEQREAMRNAQRQSWARGMAPCEHGDPDWETCPQCLEAAQRRIDAKAGERTFTPVDNAGWATSTVDCAHGVPINLRCGACEVEAAPSIDATLAERGGRYGSYMEQSRISVAIKEAMADSPNWPKLAPDQREALEMIAVKAGRILNGDPDYHDSWHDIIGYAKLVADRLA